MLAAWQTARLIQRDRRLREANEALSTANRDLFDVNQQLEDKTEAWALPMLRSKKILKLKNGVTLRWTPGQNSALDSPEIAKGRDVGNITASRKGPNGPVDIPYFVDFAFAYRAFFPDRPIHMN